jgi:hypothetical protein
MRVYLYNKNFYVGPDLFNKLKQEGYSETERNDIMSFFCPLCAKHKPSLRVHNSIIQLIGAKPDQGNYVISDTFWLQKQLFMEVLKPQFTLDHIYELICRMQMGEVITLGTDTLLYYEPETIDYREVIELINAHINEDESILFQQNIQHFLDIVRKEKEEKEMLEELQNQPVSPHVPHFEEPAWPQYPEKGWPYYYPYYDPFTGRYNTPVRATNTSVGLEYSSHVEEDDTK